jgi:aromatic-L-amino-acid decarboxylase
VETEDFRRYAHDLVDWMADYLETVEDYPVRAQVAPGEIAARLPEAPPEEGEPMERIFADFQKDVLPGMTHWQHPSFFAYFPANSSPPSVLAEMLTATLAAQCMLWQTSPAATEMETRMMDWLRRMIGLPEGFHGVIQDTASGATLCALLTARERATGWGAREQGLGVLGAAGRQLAVYASAEAHSSVEKDVMVAGLGRQALRKIPVDEAFALRPETLAEAVAADLDRGITPACVIATLGTTGTGGSDRLAPLGDICRAHGIWLHVDAAWAGSALILPEHRWMIEGIEATDSFVFNPHKWLFTNFDCSAYFVRDPEALTRTLAINPTYLASREGGRVIDYRDWGVPLGRRFRALKLWFVIRSYGVEALRRKLADHIAWAQELAAEVAADPAFDLVAPANLALFNFRHHPSGLDDEAELERLNERLLNALNDSGRLYLTQNRVRGRYALRFSVGQTTTTRDHVQGAWETIKETAAGL